MSSLVYVVMRGKARIIATLASTSRAEHLRRGGQRPPAAEVRGRQERVLYLIAFWNMIRWQVGLRNGASMP